MIHTTLLAAIAAFAYQDEFRPDAVMLRMPDVSHEQIVFGYDGDLWLVDKRGGTARALSSPPGSESLPKFDPEGRRVAFMAGYDGGSELYVLSIDGGLPVRVTHHPDREVLCGWFSDGRELLFFSNGISGQARAPRFFRVRASGGQPEPLAVPYGMWGDVDAGGRRLVYSPESWALTAHWKRYQGGLAEELWLFDLQTFASRRLTAWPGIDALPMWHGEEIVFLSDRGASGRRNLWSLDLGDNSVESLTDFDEFDVRFPSAGPDDVVFENGGKLWRHEFESGKTTAVDVRIPRDRPGLRPRQRSLAGEVAHVSPGPSGVRIAVEARGEVFSVPVEEGATRNLTRADGSAEREPAWSPDGQWIAYFSDRSGEYELSLTRDDGATFALEGASEKARVHALTQPGPGFKSDLSWAPDSKSLVFSTNTGELYRVRLSDRNPERLGADPLGEPLEVAWSPDSRWLAWSARHSRSQQGALQLYDLERGEGHEVGSGMFNDTRPCFDPSGEWLFCISQRALSPIYSNFDDSWIYANSEMVVAFPLRADVESPWSVEDPSEEPSVKPGEAQESEDAAKDEEPEATTPVRVEIELAGLEARAELLEVPPGRLHRLRCAKGKLVYLRLARDGASELDPDGESDAGGSKLVTFDLEEQEETVVLEGVLGFELCDGGAKALVQTEAGWGVIELAAEAKLEEPIDLAGLVAEFDPRREWSQILAEAGRLVRDYFYVDNAHGLDWSAATRRYQAALEDATSRDDLQFLIGELLGELNVGHAYQQGPPPDAPGSEPILAGLLGCDWALVDGAYRIERILRGGAYDLDAKSPLAEHGVSVTEGEWVLAVDGVEIDVAKDVYAAFLGRAGRPTWITVNRAPRLDGHERRALVTPIDDEGALRYRDWVAQNRERVSSLSGGRIGYVHVPDTGLEGQTELVRQFLGQYHLDALIVDERWNGGGQIPNRFIELLARPIRNYWALRHGEDWRWPPVAHDGPKAMLINGSSGSGGDCFPYYFRQSGLGKLIGMRTWGGLVGLSGNPSFVDRSAILVPRFGFYELDGTWGVEGHGVDPDIEVVDDPTRLARGEDPQLLAAIEHLKGELATWQFAKPKRPAAPDRRKAGITPQDH